MVKIGTKLFAPEWFDLDRSEKMEQKVRDQKLLKYEDNTEPYDGVGCPICGAADASHLGNIWHFGLHVGDAWECAECGMEYCCMAREVGKK